MGSIIHTLREGCSPTGHVQKTNKTDAAHRLGRSSILFIFCSANYKQPTRISFMNQNKNRKVSRKSKSDSQLLVEDSELSKAHIRQLMEKLLSLK